MGLIVTGALFEDAVTGNIGLLISLITIVPTFASLIFKIGFFNKQGNSNVVKNSQKSQRASNKKEGKFVYRTDGKRDFICYNRYFAETGEHIDTLVRQEIPDSLLNTSLNEYVRLMSSKFHEQFRFLKNTASDKEITRMLVFFFRSKHLGMLENGQFLRKSDNIILLEEVYNETGFTNSESIARIELAWIGGNINLNCSVKIYDNRGENRAAKTLATGEELLFIPTQEIFIKYRQEIMDFFTEYIAEFGYEDRDENNGLSLFSDDMEFYDFAADVWKPIFPAEKKVNEEKSETDECEVMINVLTGQLIYHSAHTYPYFSDFRTNHQAQLLTYAQMKEKLTFANEEMQKTYESMTEENWTEFL